VSLAQADRPIAEVIGAFAAHWLEVGLLVPTATGLQKSIMDAHASLRDYLRQRNVHDYGEQSQGPDAKKVIKAWLVTRAGLEETKASLYRPATKTGDPRIWFSGLPGYARPGNVLAVMAGDGGLYVVNASDRALMASAGDAGTPLGALLERLSPKAGAAARELLAKLRGIAARGYIRTLRAGPTGVGFTLETLLGIEANANRAPDYKGIEIKAGRTNSRGRATTRSTLFSMAPDWDASPYSALELLRAYGRPNADGRKQVYCTLANKPNPTFGLYLVADEADEILYSVRGRPNGPPARSDEEIFQWSLPALRAALVAKHRETFWVKARVRVERGYEAFHYFEVEHTKGPLPGNLAPLIDSGHVQLDFLLSLQRAANGSERARDHGYLFKLWERHRDLLFAPPRKYLLAS
jgi:MvaI/BcnI restriction endonuclease family